MSPLVSILGAVSAHTDTYESFELALERLLAALSANLSWNMIIEGSSQLSPDTVLSITIALMLCVFHSRTDSPRKIVFIGQSRWVNVLLDQLSTTDGGTREAQYFALPIDSPRAALRPAALRAALRADTLVRVGFRPAAETRNGRLFEAAWWLISRLNPAARQLLYWIGTDVLQTKRMLDAGINRSKFSRAIRNYCHLAGSPNLVVSLDELGVNAKLLWFPGITLRMPTNPPPYPAEFRLLTYIPDSRPDFYGGPQIINLARALDNVKVTITGGHGDWIPVKPDNVDFVGWVEDMTEHYNQAVVVVRLVEHDALGATAIEGLLFGRRVIYSRELENAIYVEFSDTAQLIHEVAALLSDFEKGILRPDTASAAWASETFCQSRRIAALKQVLLES